MGPSQDQKCLEWRQPPMEDNLKIWKIEYLSNHWSDLQQILNLSPGDQTKLKCLKLVDLLGKLLRKSQSKSWVWLCSAQLVLQNFSMIFICIVTQWFINFVFDNFLISYIKIKNTLINWLLLVSFIKRLKQEFLLLEQSCNHTASPDWLICIDYKYNYLLSYLELFAS